MKKRSRIQDVFIYTASQEVSQCFHRHLHLLRHSDLHYRRCLLHCRCRRLTRGPLPVRARSLHLRCQSLKGGRTSLTFCSFHPRSSSQLTVNKDRSANCGDVDISGRLLTGEQDAGGPQLTAGRAQAVLFGNAGIEGGQDELLQALARLRVRQDETAMPADHSAEPNEGSVTHDGVARGDSCEARDELGKAGRPSNQLLHLFGDPCWI